MISHDLNILVPWIINHGYFIFLLIATIEGPIVTIAAGIATSFSYFNLYLIIILAIIGDIGGDIIYYYLGYRSHRLINSRFFKFFGLTDKRIEKAKKLLNTKTIYAVFIAKLSPLTGPIGTIAIGAFRPKFKNFFWPALGISIVKSSFFILLGYYSGQAYFELNKVIKKGEYAVIIIFLIIGISYLFYMIISKGLVKKILNK